MRTNYEIVGYDYCAEHLCVDCTRDLAVRESLAAGSATAWGDAGTAEQVLGEWAGLLGIDRQDEHSFDQSVFPKVILHYQVEDGETMCGTCGEPLIPD